MNTLLGNWEHFFLTSSAYKLSLEVYRSILFLNVHEKLKSKTKNVKRERSRVLRSVTNLRRLQETVPNGSVYPWVKRRERTMKEIIHAA
ncbi:hypothetical protein WISP_139070 [Willisornis vidua]|uniref:Uncharacterized protein n=1 Tax=Willisornis vidua TaxID=1566151 RepID=A0ABQ9CTF7_9PASS|nr:hypothetical protein WISP_139070 [Willisornis vidua]